LISEVEKVRRDLVDKSSVNEMLETKSKLFTALEGKVELKEV
jgi:hypothetical protein